MHSSCESSGTSEHPAVAREYRRILSLMAAVLERQGAPREEAAIRAAELLRSTAGTGHAASAKQIGRNLF